MKKLFILFILVAISVSSKAQFNYSYTDESIPVTGITYGAVGGGHSAMLFNRDDIDAPYVTPQLINFTFFTGAERIKWYTPHFGIGQQALMWNAGAHYKGSIDSTEGSAALDAKTKLQYAKLPLLFYWKSYNRWHPDRRIRVNTFFGPYIAMLLSGEEDWSLDFNGVNTSHLMKSGIYSVTDQEGVEVFNGNADDSQPFKPFDYGFTMGAGAEVRLWRRTVVALTLRSDIGMAEVENKDFQVNFYNPEDPNNTVRYRFYQDIVNKFTPYSSTADPNFNFNRPETRNFSFGLQLTVRKYFGAK